MQRTGARGTVLDLRDVSALPLGLDARGRLRFGAGLDRVAPAVRRAGELRPVLRGSGPGAGRAGGPATRGGPVGAPAGSGDAGAGSAGAREGGAAAPAGRVLRAQDAAYYMYRGVSFPHHRELFRDRGLRYDVTVLSPGTIGGEYVKTFGHYHPRVPGREWAYPEVYEVLAGHGHFLLQRPGDPPDRPAPGPADGPAAAGVQAVVDVVLIEAGPGEKVLIPPGYGHVTINPGEGWLAVGNLVAVAFQAAYEPYREARGAAYHEVAGTGFLPNPAYGPVPPLRREPATASPGLGVVPGRPLYAAFTADPDRFRYLSDPSAWPAP